MKPNIPVSVANSVCLAYTSSVIEGLLVLLQGHISGRPQPELKAKNKSEKTWAIYPLASKAVYLGQVTAADEDKAVKVAIKQLPVTNRHHQMKLVARKAG